MSGLIWRRISSGYMTSDPAGFVINKSSVRGLVCYMAVRSGKPWRGYPGETEPRGWDGSEILHVERGLDPYDEPARLAAIERCKAACVDGPA